MSKNIKRMYKKQAAIDDPRVNLGIWEPSSVTGFVNSRMNLWLKSSYEAIFTEQADFKKPLAAYSTNKKNRLQGLQD